MKDAAQHFVEEAHAAAVDRTRWPSALDALGKLLGGTAVALRLQRLTSSRARILAAARFEDRYLAEHGPNLGDEALNPFVSRVAAGPLGVPILREALLSDERYLDSDLYRRFYQPQNLYHASEIAVERWGDTVAVLNMARPRRHGQLGRPDLACLESAMPHLRHALDLCRRFEDLQGERDLGYETLDQLEVAILAVDVTGRPLLMNRAAKELVARKAGLAIERGRICGLSSRDTLKLRQLVQRTAAAKGADTPGGLDAVPLACPSRERPLLVLALKGKGSAAADGDGAGDLDRGRMSEPLPLIRLFVCDPERTSSCPAETLMELHGLTRAEARLASALAAGKSLDDVAREFGIKKGTARSELSHIYSKTATHRQTELVRLLLSTSLLSGEKAR